MQVYIGILSSHIVATKGLGGMLGRFDWNPIRHQLGSQFRIWVPILGWDVCSI